MKKGRCVQNNLSQSVYFNSHVFFFLVIYKYNISEYRMTRVAMLELFKHPSGHAISFYKNDKMLLFFVEFVQNNSYSKHNEERDSRTCMRQDDVNIYRIFIRDDTITLFLIPIIVSTFSFSSLS